jgi:uncharacterized protein (DUF58 family)
MDSFSLLYEQSPSDHALHFFKVISDLILSPFRAYRNRRCGGFLFVLPLLGALVVALVAVDESTRTGVSRRLIDLQQSEEDFHKSNVVIHIPNDESTLHVVTVAAASKAASIIIENKSQGEEAYNRRPWFVMHVGPPKTAVRILAHY